MAEVITDTGKAGENGLGKVNGPADRPPFSPYHKLLEQLDAAERLLIYAAETGIEVDAKLRDTLLNAGNIDSDRWDKQTAADILSALTSLSAKLYPVTAESLRTCATENAGEKSMRTYKIAAIYLAAFTVLFSLASFITSGISKAIDGDIVKGNALAIKLGDQLRLIDSTPATQSRPQIIPSDVQEFAALIRSIDARAWRLNLYAFYTVSDEYNTAHDIWFEKRKVVPAFQIPPGEATKTEVAKDFIKVYQSVRDFAQDVKETVSIYLGATASCILPVLYALLGACAFLLRSIDRQIKSRTLTPSSAHTARFVIAGIGGAVVGLFPNFTISQTPAISPLAIAFLVGYAVDVFFSFLDTLLEPFTRRGNPPTGTKATPQQS